MIKAVIFDLNGVFLESEYLSDRFKQEFKVSVEQFLPALKEIMGVVRKQNAPPAFQLWKHYLEKWNLKLSEEEFFDFWFSGEKLISELVQYSKLLREKGLKVFILSNNFKERTTYYREHFPEIFANINQCYFSWETGFVKPSKEAFEIILKENDLEPEECIYFDDSKNNINVAQGLGIKAYEYVDLEETKRIITNFKN